MDIHWDAEEVCRAAICTSESLALLRGSPVSCYLLQRALVSSWRSGWWWPLLWDMCCGQGPEIPDGGRRWRGHWRGICGKPKLHKVRKEWQLETKWTETIEIGRAENLWLLATKSHRSAPPAVLQFQNTCSIPSTGEAQQDPSGSLSLNLMFSQKGENEW